MIILLSQSITTTYRVRFVLIVPARKYTQRYQQFFWLSYSHQSSNTQIMRTGNNNDSIIIINNISIYTVSDVGDSGNLIGSLSRTMTLYSPRWAVSIRQNKIAVVNWVFCERFIVRTFWKYKNTQVLMTLKVRKDFMVFKQRDLLWSVLL